MERIKNAGSRDEQDPSACRRGDAGHAHQRRAGRRRAPGGVVQVRSRAPTAGGLVVRRQRDGQRSQPRYLVQRGGRSGEEIGVVRRPRALAHPARAG